MDLGGCACYVSVGSTTFAPAMHQDHLLVRVVWSEQVMGWASADSSPRMGPCYVSVLSSNWSFPFIDNVA